MARTSLWLISSLVIVVGASCATAVRTIGDQGTGGGSGGGGQGGQGDQGGAQSASTGSGPCIFAQDCAGMTDACNTGTCINGVCSKLPANENAPCDDGKTCTESDTCVKGMCTGSLKFCPSADSCHLGMCDVETDTCVQVAGNEGAPCVDNDPCTQSGSCNDGQCVGGSPVDCSFLNGTCSVGVCDPQLGCVTSPVNDGTACDDNFYCTVNDVCKGGVCAGVPNTCAAPGETCKVGACDEATKKCTAADAPNGTACDDGTGCKTGSTCSNGVCQGGGAANNGAACDDNDSCTSNTVCNNGACSGGSSVMVCQSGDNCCPAGCTPNADADCGCFTDWLVGTPCNGVDFGNGCMPSETGYHFVGIFDNFACFWHHKNQAWNTSPASNFYALAQHFNITPGTGRCHWCDNMFAQPTPLAYDICQGYFDINQVGAWGWCAEVDQQSVGFVCIPTEGHLACP